MFFFFLLVLVLSFYILHSSWRCRWTFCRNVSLFFLQFRCFFRRWKIIKRKELSEKNNSSHQWLQGDEWGWERSVTGEGRRNEWIIEWMNEWSFLLFFLIVFLLDVWRYITVSVCLNDDVSVLPVCSHINNLVVTTNIMSSLRTARGVAAALARRCLCVEARKSNFGYEVVTETEKTNKGRWRECEAMCVLGFLWKCET